MRKKKEVVVEIVAVTSKGRGLAYYVDAIGTRHGVEVLKAVPGDVVRVILLRKRRGVYISWLCEIVKPSMQRVAPRCGHFDVCGGCCWQQMPYEWQLATKESVVRNLFDPLFDGSSDDFYGIVSCDPPWHYRNRMDFSFSSTKEHENFLGLMISGCRSQVFNIRECHLVNGWFADAANTVRQWWNSTELRGYHHRSNAGSLRALTLREGMRTGDRMAVLTVSGNADYALTKKHIEGFISCLRDTCEGCRDMSIFLRIHQIAKGKLTSFFEMHLNGPEYIHEELFCDDGRIRVAIGPSAFFQPNSWQSEKMYGLALGYAGITRDDVVYDLYCGVGVLGLFASLRASRVIGVELSCEAVLDARENVRNNNISNMEVFQGDVGEVLSGQNGGKGPVVIIDPPRIGLDGNALLQVLRLQPRTIIYISCNPRSQADNVKNIIMEGYRLTTICPVDQFPHTSHIENIAILSKV